MSNPRIKLINGTVPILKSILQDNKALSNILKANIPDNWTEFGDPIFNFSLEMIEKNPAAQAWLTYLPILEKTNTLIGSCGYKGHPDEDGMVEIGYEVSASHRRQGFATEIIQLLIDKAFSDKRVTVIQAHTLATENPSVKTLKKFGFQNVEQLEDEEDGPIWKWVLIK